MDEKKLQPLGIHRVRTKNDFNEIHNKHAAVYSVCVLFMWKTIKFSVPKICFCHND